MGKRLKRVLKIVAGIGIGFVILIFALQWVLKSKLENHLNTKMPEAISLNYAALNLNLFSGNLSIDALDLKRIGQTTNRVNIHLKLKKLIITDFGYWNYVINKRIHISEIQFLEPEVTYFFDDKISKDAYINNTSKEFNKTIEVDAFKLENGTFEVYNTHNDSLLLGSQNIQVNLEAILYNKDTKSRKIPIDYGVNRFQVKNIIYQLSNYDNVTVEKLNFTNGNGIMNAVSLKTKYSKEELSRMIPVERDHYDLVLDSIKTNKFNFGFRQDSILQIKSSNIAFYQPTFNVYRDKLVADDVKIKPLYSKMLRDLKFDLSLKKVAIVGANIRYSEKVKTDKEAGTITFTDFNANIKNMSNTYLAPIKTTIDIKTQFMNHAPLQANWEFDVNDVSDRFLFQADIGLLKAADLNRFTEPNLNVRLEGQLDKTYLTINGNHHVSDVDFKVKYDAFNVVALKKNGTEKNKFLSGLVNLFVSKNSKVADNDFIGVTKKQIARNKNQSVFNYIWINTRAGLLKAMTFE